MKPFNKLRQRIVEKLIRPEDGYTFTGFDKLNRPFKIFYNEESKMHVMGTRQGYDAFFIKPTLSGWKPCDNARDMLSTLFEIDFQDWIRGVVADLIDEYCNRLSNMTRKDLMSFNKDYVAVKKPISKQYFCEAMDVLSKDWENVRSTLGYLFDEKSNPFKNMFSYMIETLSHELEPNLGFHEDSLIARWLFEFDAGRDEKAVDGIDGHPLTSAEELYDYLMYQKNLSETIDKFENM